MQHTEQQRRKGKSEEKHSNTLLKAWALAKESRQDVEKCAGLRPHISSIKAQRLVNQSTQFDSIQGNWLQYLLPIILEAAEEGYVEVETLSSAWQHDVENF